VLGGVLLVEIAYSDTDPTPTNWTNFASGAYTGRYFRFRLTVSTKDTSYGVNLYSFEAIFDVPDKTDQGSNISISGSGWTTVNLTDFASVKSLIITPVGNPYVVELDQTSLPTSFDVKLKDPGNSMAQVAGNINYLVKGY